MTRMLEDKDSADEEFWNQDAFKEEHEDSEYESEEEVADGPKLERYRIVDAFSYSIRIS